MSSPEPQQQHYPLPDEPDHLHHYGITPVDDHHHHHEPPPVDEAADNPALGLTTTTTSPAAAAAVVANHNNNNTNDASSSSSSSSSPTALPNSNQQPQQQTTSNTTNNTTHKTTHKRPYPLFMDTHEKLRIAQIYIKLLIQKHQTHHHPHTKPGAAAHKTSGIGCRQLAQAANIGKTTANKIMNELKEWGGIRAKPTFRNSTNRGSGTTSGKGSPPHAAALQQLFRDADAGVVQGQTFCGKLTVKEYQDEFHRRTQQVLSYDAMRHELNDYKWRRKQQQQQQAAQQQQQQQQQQTNGASSLWEEPPHGAAASTEQQPPQVHIPCVDANGNLVDPAVIYGGTGRDNDPNDNDDHDEDDDDDDDAEWAQQEEADFWAPEAEPEPAAAANDDDVQEDASAAPRKKQKVAATTVAVNVANAIDLTSSAFNALHHDQVSTAVQRLTMALQELGQTVTTTTTTIMEDESHMNLGTLTPPNTANEEEEDDDDFDGIDDDDDGT